MATSAKENILKRVRQALSNPVPLPFPGSEGASSLFAPPNEELEVLFAQEFTSLQGKFAFCENEQDLHLQLQQLITEKQWTKIYCSEDFFHFNFQSGNIVLHFSPINFHYLTLEFSHAHF